MSHDHGHGHGAVDLSDLPGAAPDPTPAPTFVAATVAILITVVTILFVMFLYHWAANREAEQKVIDRGHPELEALRLRHREQLGQARRENGKLVSIPIERAMELIQAEKRQGS